jgi:hypothetical protein
MAMTRKDDIIHLLEQCSVEERREIFNHLRREFPIHRLEADLNTQAEVILEAMARSSDLTMRGIRGIIAEAAFLVDVLQKLDGWRIVEIVGDAPYDFLIEDGVGRVSIQVKMQRRQKGTPFVRGGKFVVETQRTRTGKDSAGGATRPYRFGEFDILAVSLHPSTNDWATFAYTVGTWLRPRLGDPNLLEVFQPIPSSSNEDWTDSLETCIERFRSGVKRTIAPF